jgi:hypothetical protein
MHSGFQSLRQACPMNIGKKLIVKFSFLTTTPL